MKNENPRKKQELLKKKTQYLIEKREKIKLWRLKHGRVR